MKNKKINKKRLKMNSQKRDKNVFCFNIVNEALVSENNNDDTDIKNNLRIIESDNKNSNIFEFQRDCFHDFDKFLNKVDSDLSSMNLTQKETNAVFDICKNLLINTEYLLKSLMISSNSEYAVSEGLNFIINRLRLRDSTYKRQKKIENTKYYVKPEEKPIGSKWRMVPNSSKSIPDYELIQRRFQFVAISETLRSLFDNDVFKQMFLEYNNKKPHTCENGSYYDFCCGA